MIREIAAGETHLAYPAMRELRTMWPDEAEFVRYVDEQQRPEGFRVVGAFEEGASSEDAAVAVAGFRTGHALGWGHYLYVDDLSTAAASRRAGHARALLDWLVAEAGRLGCTQVHLDSAVGLERRDAHRLYLNAGFVIASHHFVRGVG